MDENLTAGDFDWLRKLKAAADANREPPSMPMIVAVRLGSFGFAKPTGRGDFTITSKGLDALLDQDMRDAEQR